MTDDIFDREYHHHNFSDSPQLLQDLLDLFTMDVVGLSQDINQAFHNEDLPTIAAISHKIKGASASVGAIRMKKASEKIEVAARSGDSGLLGSLLPLLDEEVQAIIRERRSFAIG